MRRRDKLSVLVVLIVGGCGQILIPDLDAYHIRNDEVGGGGAGASTSSSSSSLASSSSSTGMGGGGGGGGMGGASGTGGSGGQGGALECVTDTECLNNGPTDFCGMPKCLQGACVRETLQPDGAPLPSQLYGDCIEKRCDSLGNIIDVYVDDAYDDSKNCTTDVCTNGVLTHDLVAIGTVCTNPDGFGGICDGNGACVSCIDGVQGCAGAFVCQMNKCVNSKCINGTKDPGESDIDCGAVGCLPCADGKLCVNPSQCASGVCTGGTCAEPACADGSVNGNETGFDCGGFDCPKCTTGERCEVPNDCQSGVCIAGFCAASSCTDAVKNGDETDIDCGGSCMNKCMNCMNDGDCSSGYCNAMMTCAAPTCMDMVQNGNETDTDCGGPDCPDCMNGDSCNVKGDCVSTYCNAMMTCATPTCMDMVQNGTENGVDCGGTCLACNGSMCTNNNECSSGMCYEGACVGSINGCDINTAQDFTMVAPPPITFANGNFTYAPKCIKVKTGTLLTLNGNFAVHPMIGGTVVGGTVTLATSGPFVPVTDSGTTKNFTMDTAGIFPYYCQPHATIGMNATVFVVP